MYWSAHAPFSFQKELAALGQKAKADKIAIEDMTGGSFTISNGGVYGSLMGTPIINPPQSGLHFSTFLFICLSDTH